MILFERRACGILYNLLRSLPGDRPFLLPANVCPVVPMTFRKAGRELRCLDLDPEDLGMDVQRCLKTVAERPEDWAGVLYVRPYGAETAGAEGFFRDLKELRPDLLVIDDRCLCAPDCDGERLSTAADVTLFSTGRTKPVDLGFGGFAHCRGEVPYRRFADEAGSEDWLDLSVAGLEWDAYRSAVREELPKAQEQRRRLNAIYEAALPVGVRLPAPFQGWRFHLRVSEPDRLVERLFAAGLFASRHYASLGAAGQFPVAERLHRQIVNLFNDRYFDAERARRAVDCVLRHLEEGSPA
ncbi:MAG TPA: hypothetical protein VF173_38100 [Thermoanaerobaculia bacterium]|nr:hypothetical protein [Thermoanaerobaculia bacterium]